MSKCCQVYHRPLKKKKIELPKYSSNNLYDIVLDQHEREERVLILSRTFALRDEDYI